MLPVSIVFPWRIVNPKWIIWTYYGVVLKRVLLSDCVVTLPCCLRSIMNGNLYLI